MSIIFSLHAELKIEQRKIPRQYVVQTIDNPNFEKPAHDLRTELYRKFGKNYLKVVIKREASNIIVVTAHWVAKVKNR